MCHTPVYWNLYNLCKWLCGTRILKTSSGCCSPRRPSAIDWLTVLCCGLRCFAASALIFNWCALPSPPRWRTHRQHVITLSNPQSIKLFEEYDTHSTRGSERSPELQTGRGQIFQGRQCSVRWPHTFISDSNKCSDKAMEMWWDRAIPLPPGGRSTVMHSGSLSFTRPSSMSRFEITCNFKNKSSVGVESSCAESPWSLQARQAPQSGEFWVNSDGGGFWSRVSASFLTVKPESEHIVISVREVSWKCRFIFRRNNLTSLMKLLGALIKDEQGHCWACESAGKWLFKTNWVKTQDWIFVFVCTCTYDR